MVVLHLGHGHTPEAAEGSPGARCEPCHCFATGLLSLLMWTRWNQPGLWGGAPHGAVDRNLCP